MKPIFTIHAGEYLVGNFLEKELPNCELWIPAKDTGIDLLVTNREDKSRNVSLQVKFSKDFLPQMQVAMHGSLLASGWWTFNLQKMKNCVADYWVIALYSFSKKEISSLYINPQIFHGRLIDIHGESRNTLQSYFSVTSCGKCFETRGLTPTVRSEIAMGDFTNVPAKRNFTDFLKIDEMKKKL